MDSLSLKFLGNFIPTLSSSIIRVINSNLTAILVEEVDDIALATIFDPTAESFSFRGLWTCMTLVLSETPPQAGE